MVVSQQNLESLAVKAYNEFYDLHKDLFSRNPREYWRLATAYKEQALLNHKIRNDSYSQKQPGADR